MARKVCPVCGTANDLKASRCADCGANLTGGRRPPLRSERPKDEGGMFAEFLDLFPGFSSGRTVVWVAIMLLVAVDLGLHSYGYTRLRVQPTALRESDSAIYASYSYPRLHVHPTAAPARTYVPLTAAAIVAGIAALIFYCTGIMWLLYGYVCAPMEALLAFDGKRWLILVLLALVPVAVVISLPSG
jgi:hypothetical protein